MYDIATDSIDGNVIHVPVWVQLSHHIHCVCAGSLSQVHAQDAVAAPVADPMPSVLHRGGNVRAVGKGGGGGVPVVSGFVVGGRGGRDGRGHAPMVSQLPGFLFDQEATRQQAGLQVEDPQGGSASELWCLGEIETLCGWPVCNVYNSLSPTGLNRHSQDQFHHPPHIGGGGGVVPCVMSKHLAWQP